MNATSQHSSHSLIGLIEALLIVTLAVALMSTLALWLIDLPVQTASAAAALEDTAPTPTPTASADSPAPSATPEPTSPPTHGVPTATPPADEPLEESASCQVHTVREGDTLSVIAEAYGVSVADLVAANDLSDPNLLTVGWTLVIPDGDPVRPTSPISPEEPSAPAPTELPQEPTPIPAPASPGTIDEERWIDVDLSEQRLTAFEGTAPVHTFLVSTGLPATPTPVGQFRIWIKLRSDDMSGPGYYIEDVPYVMYFYQGYGLHGVTWHGNFGHPMSHGCVNLPTEEAEWLFGFADVGTLVNVHE
jgi:lipoprotein-anchoring transpeptidase ErfK/SrfK